MKFKTMTLTKEKFEEMENLLHDEDDALAAFFTASKMLRKANRKLWDYIKYNFPEIPEERASRFNREKKRFEYYVDDIEK